MPANSRDGEGTIDSRNYGSVDNNVSYQSGLFQTVERSAEPQSSAFGNSENPGTRSFYHGAAGK